MPNIKCHMTGCAFNTHYLNGPGECTAENVELVCEQGIVDCISYEAKHIKRKYCGLTANEGNTCPEDKRICCIECDDLGKCTSQCCNLIACSCSIKKMYEE